VNAYRADIDGLRGLAIVPVVLYHYHVAPFTGGFVGVDIFFVISGFLITSLIHAEMRTGAFSIVHFYERRIRRIVPALVLVLAAASILGVLLLFPGDLERYADSLLSTAIFGSNFEFWNRSGYFDVAAERKPLLHTWSLAIEEQFYLLFPVALYALRRLSSKLRLTAVGVVLAASLALSIWGARSIPISAFYLLPFRTWELMLGTLLALGGVPVPRSRLLCEAIAATGFALIAWSVLAFSPDTLFPGESALVPCLGTALLIYVGSGARTAVGALFSTRPIVALGLVSYSLYLWHWPLLVFARYLVFRDLSAWETWGLIAVSGVLAFLSWRFVEQAFRGPRALFSRRAVFRMAAVAAAVTVAASVIGKLSGGWPQRFDPATRATLAVADDASAKIAARDLCRDGPAPSNSAATMWCRIGSVYATAPSFILWGDSHAAMLYPVIAETAIKAKRSGLFIGHHSCPPLLGVKTNRSRHCREFNDEAARFAAEKPIAEVILTSFWGAAAEGVPYEDVNGPRKTLLTDDQSRSPSLAGNKVVFARGLERLVAQLTGEGKKVVIIASVPEVGWPVPETLARIRLFHLDRDISPPLPTYLERQRSAFTVFEDVREKYGVTIVYPHRVLCPSGRCMVALQGVPIYADSHHLNYLGAKALAPLLDPIL
jgi:peptidoglycan/LPS O-acetylase OafA/YrhL